MRVEKLHPQIYSFFQAVFFFVFFSDIFFSCFCFSKLKQRVGFFGTKALDVWVSVVQLNQYRLEKCYVENCHSSILCWNVWFFFLFIYLYLPFCFVDGTSIKKNHGEFNLLDLIRRYIVYHFFLYICWNEIFIYSEFIFH